MPDRPYSRLEICNQMELLFRDETRMARLLWLSSLLWRRDCKEDLVLEAFRRILNAHQGAISSSYPFHKTVAQYMRWQAVDWGRRREPGNLITGVDEKALEAVTAPDSGRKSAHFSSDEPKTAQPGFKAIPEWLAERSMPTPEDDCYAHQVLTKLFERIGNNTLLRDYIIARYVDDLKGEDLRLSLSLTKARFASLTRRANRMLNSIKDEISR